MEDVTVTLMRKMGLSVAPIRTFLIQKGYFVGHKYRFDGGYAVRRAGENAIEIYDDSGRLLKTVNLGDKGSAAA